MTTQAAVELIGLSKTFGDVVANADIHLRVAPGTIHAVIGENGAGKSTAMKMLYGIYRPDGGEIRIGGEAVRWSSPMDAIARGIGMVHQHFMLADPLDAVDNIVVGAEPARAGRGWLPSWFRPVDRQGARAKLRKLAGDYGLSIDFDRPVEELPVGVQQRIEIIKMLYRDARILILDEPTAVLTPQETGELFAQLRKLRDEGRTVIIITHKLKEVMAVADEVTVFRAGRVVGQVRTADTGVEKLAALMVGRHVRLTADAPADTVPGEAVLEVRDLRCDSSLKGVDLSVRGGEIVGIAGVEGNGQSELLHAIFNQADTPGSGTIRILGRDVFSGGKALLDAAGIRRLGVGWIPADRHREALLLDRPVRENFLLGHHRDPDLARGGRLDLGAIGGAVARAIEEFDVRPRDPEARAGGLSGGNQQKVVIARELHDSPRLIVAAQPTRGVDVGAIEFIHGRLLAERAKGAGVLLVSSELDEILALSDRILVMYEGRIVAEFARGQAGEQALGLAMGGAGGGRT